MAACTVLGFPDYHGPARALAAALEVPYREAVLHRFPDGESLVTLPETLTGTVVLCRSLDRPNDKLVELLLAARTARELGARRLILVAPYLCYMRQDKAFHPGEAVSQRIIGEFLAGLVDTVISVDPHLHRIPSLAEAIPARQARALPATTPMGEFLARQQDHDAALLMGPDSESRQWVQALAEHGGLPFLVAEKRRHGDRDVSVTLPDHDYRGLTVTLVDDMISTGRSACALAEQLMARGAARVRALVTHALFDEADARRMRTAGIETVWSSDSVLHASNRIALAPLLAAAVREVI